MLSIHRIVWFASCIRIASTRFLPGTQLPIVQAIRHGRHHRGGMGMGRGMGMGGGGMMQPNNVYVVEGQPVYQQPRTINVQFGGGGQGVTIGTNNPQYYGQPQEYGQQQQYGQQYPQPTTGYY